jgi:hypothetical protein
MSEYKCKIGSQHFVASTSYPGTEERIKATDRVNSFSKTKADILHTELKANDVISELDPEIKTIMKGMLKYGQKGSVFKWVRDIVRKNHSKELNAHHYITSLTTQITEQLETEYEE